MGSILHKKLGTYTGAFLLATVAGLMFISLILWISPSEILSAPIVIGFVAIGGLGLLLYGLTMDHWERFVNKPIRIILQSVLVICFLAATGQKYFTNYKNPIWGIVVVALLLTGALFNWYVQIKQDLQRATKGQPQNETKDKT